MEASSPDDQEKNSPDALADEREREADRLEERSEELGDEIAEVRSDWERKKADPSVPGAVDPDDKSDQDNPAAGEGSPV